MIEMIRVIRWVPTRSLMMKESRVESRTCFAIRSTVALGTTAAVGPNSIRAGAAVLTGVLGTFINIWINTQHIVLTRNATDALIPLHKQGTTGQECHRTRQPQEKTTTKNNKTQDTRQQRITRHKTRDTKQQDTNTTPHEKTDVNNDNNNKTLNKP